MITLIALRLLQICRNGKKKSIKCFEEPVDVSEVVDVDEVCLQTVADADADLNVTRMITRLPLPDKDLDPALLNPKMRIFAFERHPGLFLLRDAISLQLAARLADDCFQDFLQPPTHTNFNRSHKLYVKDLWAAHSKNLSLEDKALYQDDYRISCWSTHGEGPKASYFLEKLRWASIGPRYDWTSREYMIDEPYTTLPEYMETLARQAVSLAMAATKSTLDSFTFNPNAALINYYRDGDTLCGHRDDAEKDLSKPLVSLSLGCPAIFLMGGLTRDDAITPIFLRNRDIVLLCGQARKSYHGVPRIFPKMRCFKMAGDGETKLPKGMDMVLDPHNLSPIQEYLQQSCRINISIRDVGD